MEPSGPVETPVALWRPLCLPQEPSARGCKQPLGGTWWFVVGSGWWWCVVGEWLNAIHIYCITETYYHIKHHDDISDTDISDTYKAQIEAEDAMSAELVDARADALNKKKPNNITINLKNKPTKNKIY